MTGCEKGIHTVLPGIPGEGITLKELMDHLAGPVISLAIHLLALGILGSVVLAKAPEKAPEELLVEIRDVIVEAVPELREERREMPEETLEESPVFDLSRPLPENTGTASEVMDPIQLSGTLEDIAMPTPAVPHTKSALKLSVTSTFGTLGNGDGKSGASGRKKNSYEAIHQKYRFTYLNCGISRFAPFGRSVAAAQVSYTSAQADAVSAKYDWQDALATIAYLTGGDVKSEN